MHQNVEVRNAFLIGGLCSMSYLAVYITRNLLGAVSPQMIENGSFTTESIGILSSLFFIFYAVGQLINGIIGDKVKAKYMISFGLLLAGVSNYFIPSLAGKTVAVYIVYSLSGFFLSMIYAPMSKVVAENMKLLYAIRCSMGFEFAALFGSPLAGIIAAVLVWQNVFKVGNIPICAMGLICFIVFGYMEKKKIITYHKYDREEVKGIGGKCRILLKHDIAKFTGISILTGVVRTTVVFWLPTYISQHLGFAPDRAAIIYTAATLLISLTTFIAIFVYEKLKYNMELTILLAFSMAALFFLTVYFFKHPICNIIALVLAIMSSNSVATMMWSVYCPRLRDTGLVSSAVGYLDFASYMAAATASAIFANAVTKIGWGNLILVWFALMLVGIAISLPYKSFGKKVQ